MKLTIQNIGLYSILLCLMSCHHQASKSENFEYSLQKSHMGTVFQITVIGQNEKQLKAVVKNAYEEVKRIENLISSWDSTSETSAINRNAGIQPVKVSDELFRLIERSKKISSLTDGIFDISFASIDKLWKFDGSMTTIPNDSLIAASVNNIDFQKIELNRQDTTAFLIKKGMKIGFGGIGKGYAANQCKKLLLSKGIESGIVNAGGDLIIWGRQKNDKNWTIGIADPNQKESAFSYLTISNKAVVTSGNYERFIEIDGKKYCHIINPETGWPAALLTSVTVICADAEVADALATSVFVLGVKDGLQLVNQIKDIECFIVDEQGKTYASKGIDLEYE